MIVSPKEKAEDLERCLNTLKGKVDKVFIVITGKPNKKLKELAEKKAEVKYKEFFYTVSKKMVSFIKKMGLDPVSKVGDKLFEFDKARNYSMSMVPKKYKWLFWIDTDDILRGDLRGAVKKAEKMNADSVFLNYIYDSEIVDGKVKSILIEHQRERLIKNDGSYKWVAPIHETLIEQRPTRKVNFKKCDILHLSTAKKKKDCIERNLKNLEYNIYQKKAKDPRPLYYLGKAYWDKWLLTKDKKYLQFGKILFDKYLTGEHKSGWAEERAQCWEYLVEIYRTVGQFDEAIKCGHNAMIEDERFPSIYINMAMSYLVKKEWDRALFWLRMSTKMPQPDSTLITTPRDLQGRALEVVYHASLNLTKLDDAWAAAHRLVELYPQNKEFKERYNLVGKMREERDITKTVVTLAQYLQQKGEPYKLKPLVQSIPNVIQNNPFMADLIKQVNPPRKWEKNEICIYCGPGFTSWNPGMLEKPDGFVGGSEEAVMYMAQELKKQGWKVTVYAEPGTGEGDWDGVKYEQHFKFNTKDEFNILIGWRRVDLVDQNLKAKKIYIWCHDIQNQLDYTPQRLKKITKVMVLSPWHRENIPDVPDNKVMITGNGIKL